MNPQIPIVVPVVDYSKYAVSPLPAIYITPNARAKLETYIDLAKGEISGLGEVKQILPNKFLIGEVHLFEQVTTGSDTELNPEDLAKFMRDCISKGIDITRMKLWWHSHANMATFWSLQTDMVTVDSFDNGVNDWMISVVGNKHGDFLARLDIYHPVRVAVDNLKLEIFNQVDGDLLKQLTAEVEAKVKFNPPPAIAKLKKKKGKFNTIAAILLPKGSDDDN